MLNVVGFLHGAVDFDGGVRVLTYELHVVHVDDEVATTHGGGGGGKEGQSKSKLDEKTTSFTKFYFLIFSN